MNYIDLRCRREKCVIDSTTEMEIRKCITQNDKEHPDTYNLCPYLRVSLMDEYSKGDVWKKFGNMIDKSKPQDKKKLF